MSELRDLMVDIETMGNTPGAVILSIGAVEFDILSGITGRRFHRHIKMDSSLAKGFHVDGSTVMWWMQQSDEARAKICGEVERVNIETALQEFAKFVREIAPERIWGNGVRFDLGLLEAAYRKFYEPVPWSFRGERDVRTLLAFVPNVKETIKMKGTMHDAIDDCLYQIECCAFAYNDIVSAQSLREWAKLGDKNHLYEALSKK